MGKIFDALEKSKKRDSTSLTTNKTFGTVSKGQTEKQEASFDRNEIRNKGNAGDAFLRKEIDKSEYPQRESHVIPIDKTEVLYDENKIDQNLIVHLRPNSFEAEQFKILRTNLLFPSSGRSPRSIMVTSAVPDEGKSFVSANLAVSIAQSIQEHVLLVDCDIRVPTIHKLFGFGNVSGLSDHLANGASLSSLILGTPVNKLSILPGGKPPHNPSELLSSQLMSKLLQEVKYRYSDRYIVIDSPPPKLTAETAAISRQVDGVLLVVECGTTPRKMVLDLIETIGKEKILGIILNKLDTQFESYYGLGKYQKYGKYYRS
jgi:exopolysaccharide/PEP-CTERM locus tyrosine autokinase